MSFFEFPHSRTYDSDLGWIIKRIRQLMDDYNGFVATNALKYASPLLWSISKAYEPNTVVVDEDGNGYISLKGVPAGIALDNTDYWLMIFNFSEASSEVVHWIANTLITHDNFYNVLNNGVVADDGTDQLEAIKDLVVKINNAGGGYLYFPQGEYIVSNPIHVPANTVVFGDGRNSIVRHSPVTGDTDAKSGTFTICGDNVEVFNLSIENDSPYTGIGLVVGAQDGGLGITNVSFPWDAAGNWVGYTRVAERKNVYIHDIWSDSIYPLQAEVATGTGVLKNIRYDNIIAPNGLVSFMPWWGDVSFTEPGMIDSTMNNITAKAVRVGGVYSAAPNKGCNGRGIKLNNIYCSDLQLYSNGILAENIEVDNTDEVIWYTLSTGTGDPRVDAVVVSGNNIQINNMHVVGDPDHTTTVNGVKIFCDEPAQINNLKVEDFKTNYIYTPDHGTGIVMHYFANCDGYAAAAGRITGYGVNCNLHASTGTPFYQSDKILDLGAITLGTGFANPANNRVYRRGNEYMIDFYMTGTVELVSGLTLGSFAASLAPSAAVTGNIIAWGSSGSTAANSYSRNITIDTDGTIKMSAAIGAALVGTTTALKITARWTE